jgi:hypothetical protein
MNFLFLFLDGVGLGGSDPQTNPLAAADMPVMESLLGGGKLIGGTAPWEGARATLLALDANLGVPGLPQSATGQAALVTGRNVPAEVGMHFGPKPNSAIAGILEGDNIFKTLNAAGRRAGLLNAYPRRYFEGIESGHRMYSSIPLAVTSGGARLHTEEDYFSGRALSADFTGAGWRGHLGYEDAPLYTPDQAGRQLGRLAQGYHFAFFEFWASDYAGHYQDMPAALNMLEEFDAVLGGLLEVWDETAGLILITSDHGNMEDLSTKRHTDNPVPGLVIGAPDIRRDFTHHLRDLTGVTPAALRFLGV